MMFVIFISKRRVTCCCSRSEPEQNQRRVKASGKGIFCKNLFFIQAALDIDLKVVEPL
jgi:hypothetical protein